jgi:hypothetical protein
MPKDLADEYRVRVEMKAEPFAIEQNNEAVFRKSDLVPASRPNKNK